MMTWAIIWSPEELDDRKKKKWKKKKSDLRLIYASA